MPISSSEEFVPNELPEDLDPETEVFYCKFTNEAFLSYDEFYERYALCTRPSWTCSVTGKTGLTYAQALQSERDSTQTLSSIPRVLQRALLHLVTYMDADFSLNMTLGALCEYTSHRYFIGETVRIGGKNKKRVTAMVCDVVPPPVDPNSPGLDPMKYQYIVEFPGNRKKQSDLFEKVPASLLHRGKCSISKDKIRLFLRHHMVSSGSRYDSVSLKEESIKEFALKEVRWESIFKGPTPNFYNDTTYVRAYKKNADFSQASPDDITDDDVNVNVPKKKEGAPQKRKYTRRVPLAEGKGKTKKIKKNGKIKNGKAVKGKGGKIKNKKGKVEKVEEEESKQSIMERKLREKEFRRQFEEDLKVYNEKRDDLLCDDLKPLPLALHFDCDLKNELISESISILEFVNQFNEYIMIEDSFPNGLSFELFIQVLQDDKIDGPFSDLLLCLMRTIFSHNGNVEDELPVNDDFDQMLGLDENQTSSSNVQLISYINFWVTNYFSTHEQLSKLTLDSFTLTEILRIYLYKTRNHSSKLPHSLSDDVLQIVDQLTKVTVFELDSANRLKLINLLINEIVMIPEIREQMDESLEEIYKLKNQIRHINATYTKWLRDNPIRQKMRRKYVKQADKEKQTEVAESQDPVDITEEEKEQFRNEKLEKETEMQTSISELKSKIRVLNAKSHPRPLGVDRAYRKYWIFQSIPGLLVEHPLDVSYCRSCLDNVDPAPKPQLTDYLPNAKKRAKKGQKKALDQSMNSTDGGGGESGTRVSQLGIFDRCTGNQETCSVHGHANIEQRVEWSFYTGHHLDQLLKSLNPRGLRESDLKTAITFEKQSIMERLEKFNPIIYNRNYVAPVESTSVDEDDSSDVRKSERLQHLNDDKTVSAKEAAKHVLTKSQYTDLPPQQAHLVAFQDLLKYFEEQICDSCFSSFNREDRESWYSSLNKIPTDPKVDPINIFLDLIQSLARSLKPLCLLAPLATYQESSASSPSNKENLEALPIKVPRISEKWLNSLRPYTSDEDDCLPCITSLSQLFVNYYVLEKSINWELSALKTANKCKICRRKANEEMILCDLCNRGFHIYCLNPPITSIADIEGDWFCKTCLPTFTPVPVKGKQLEDDAEVLPEQEEPAPVVVEPATVFADKTPQVESKCLVCKKLLFNDSSEEVTCKTCSSGCHLDCAQLSRVPRSWNCKPCEAKQKSSQKYHEEPEEDSAERRRSNRKRKPNNYYDDENGSAGGGGTGNGIDESHFYSKNGRYSPSDDVYSKVRKSRRSSTVTASSATSADMATMIVA